MLHIAGQDLAVFTTPSQVTRILNDNHSYSFDPYIDLIYATVGNVSGEAKGILWRTPAEGFMSLHPNPKKEVLVHTGNRLLHKQLMQSDAMQDLVGKVLLSMHHAMQWDSFYDTTVLASNANEKVVSLHCWCRDVLVEAQNKTFFGHQLSELEPDMRFLYDQWDYNSWRVTYQLPSFMAKPATYPRDRMIQALTKYLDTPKEHRTGVVPFISELQDECMNAGLSNQDIAGIMMIILWG